LRGAENQALSSTNHGYPVSLLSAGLLILYDGVFYARRLAVKRSALLFASLMLISLLGCSGTNKDTAVEPAGSIPLEPTEAAGANGAKGNVAPVEAPGPDAHASGGTTLAVSTPYNQPNAPAVAQNLNPTPFLVSTAAKGATTQQPGTPGLTSRADGTMSGPQDQPAAGIGPGTMGGTEGNAYPNKSFQGAGRKSGAGGTPPSAQSNQGAIPK
jgi:hypothetical protein